MALVADGFGITMNVADKSGSISTLRFEMNVADQAAADAAVGGILTDFQAITQSKVMSYWYYPIFREDDISLPTSQGAINSIKASCTLVLDALGGPKANFKIPAPLDNATGIFVAQSGKDNNRVNGSNALVLAFFEHFTTTDGDLFISDGETLVDDGFFDSGKRISARSNNP